MPRAAGGVHEHALRVRLAGARQAGEEHERPRADELDDAPLLVRHVEVGPGRPLEQLGAGGAGARAEGGGEPAFALPQLGAVGALALDDDLVLAHEPVQRRLERLRVAHLEQPRRRGPELLERQERVPVGLGLLEHEAQAGAQALRRVGLDPERARDPVGKPEADARQLDQPVRVVLEHGEHVVAVGADEPRREPGADRRAQRGTPRPRGSPPPRARRRPPARPRGGRSRARPSSAPRAAAPGRGRAPRRRARRRSARRSRLRTSARSPGRACAARGRRPPPRRAAPSGRTRPRTASRSARAARTRRRRRGCPRPPRDRARRGASAARRHLPPGSPTRSRTRRRVRPSAGRTRTG